MYKIGDSVKLLKGPALLNGVFTPLGRAVEVVEIDPAGLVTVKFLDREGNPHLIKGLKAEQLGPL